MPSPTIDPTMPAAVSPTAVPATNPTPTAQQAAQTQNATTKGVSPRSAFSSDEGYQRYKAKVAGYGPTTGPETNPAAAPWVNKTTDPGGIPAAPAAAPAATPSVTMPETPTTPAAPTISPEEAALRKAGADIVNDEGRQSSDIARYKAEDLGYATNAYNASLSALQVAQSAVQSINAQRVAAIDASTGAQKAENDAAYNKAQANLTLQKEETDNAYEDMINAQTLANKRANVQKETALGVLGGAFTTAGVASIMDVIMQGEYALTSLKKDKNLKDTGLTNDMNAILDDHNVKNMKIEAWKVDELGKAYADLQGQVVKIAEDTAMAEVDKQKELTRIADLYNGKASEIHANAIQAQYVVAQDTYERAQQLQKDAAAAAKDQAAATNYETDNARQALQGIVTTFGSSYFENLTPEQEDILAKLEEKAGYIPGQLTKQIKTLKELSVEEKAIADQADIEMKKRMADLKEMLGDKVHYVTDNVTQHVTALIYDATTGQVTQQDLGPIGAASSAVAKAKAGLGGGSGGGSGGTGDPETDALLNQFNALKLGEEKGTAASKNDVKTFKSLPKDAQKQVVEDRQKTVDSRQKSDPFADLAAQYGIQ